MINSFDFNEDWTEFAQSLEEMYECPVCLESFNLKSNNLIKSCCNHIYCKTCYGKINECALCKTNFNKQRINLQQNQQQNPQLNPSENNYLRVDYVYLDTNERRRFANARHEYLIDQTNQQNPQQTFEETVDNYRQQYRHILNFNHPVRELIFNRNN